MNTTTWLAIDPVDTLFFRGAESMEAGENHEVDTMFPPMPATITGAIRTAILRQKGIAPAEYLKNPENWQRQHPLLGTPDQPGFTLLGPLFLAGENLLLPTPAHWFADLPESSKMEWGKEYPLQVAATLDENPLGLAGSVTQPFWVRQPVGSDMKALNGWWTTLATFSALEHGHKEITFINNHSHLQSGKAAILPASSLFDREERVGIALTPQRTAKEGHLYSAVHVRLREGISLVAGINSEHPWPLDGEGILQLGGEQRVCHYHRLTELALPKKVEGKHLLALGPVELSALSPELALAPRASGKLLRIGGWDMEKGFHKPMSAWLPAGTVISCHQANEFSPQFLTI